MNQPAILTMGASNLAGIVIMILLAAMTGSWFSRLMLLRTLRIRHPDQFAALGYPSSRQLASLSPKLQELHIKFWKYLWGGQVFLVNDKLVSALACFALVLDIAMVGSAVALFWAAWK